MVKMSERERCLESELLHQQIDIGVLFETVQVVGVAMETHEQTAKGDVRFPAMASQSR